MFVSFHFCVCARAICVEAERVVVDVSKSERQKQRPVCRWDSTLGVTAVCELPERIQSDKSVEGRDESTRNKGEKLMNLDAGHGRARWTT